MPFHTLHCQLMPMDRNHLLYRIIEGNLDKDALIRILGIYVETRLFGSVIWADCLTL